MFSVLALFLLNGIRLMAVLAVCGIESVRIIFEKQFVNRAENKQKNASNQDNNSFVWIQWSIITYYIFTLSEVFISNFNKSLVNIFLGTLLAVFAIVIRHYSYKILGEYFSLKVVIKENHKLMTTGIYSRVRHPLYLGILIMYLGYITICFSICGLIVFVVFLLPAYINRINTEEKVLMERFGEQYKDYMDVTHKLIPFIW